MTLAEKWASIIDSVFRPRRKIEKELQDVELRFRQLTENIREVFYIVDPKMTRMFYISPGYEEIWGRSRESLYADPMAWREGIHADDREWTMEAVAPHGTLIPYEIEHRVVRPDDTVRWVWNRAFPVRDERGEIYRFTGIVEDITERKRSHDQITEQAERLEQSNRRLSLLGEMTSLLQTATSVDEAAEIVGGYMAQVHVGDSGALYLYRESRNALDLVARWGEQTLHESLAPDECWGLRRGQLYRPPGEEAKLRCKHVQRVDGPATYLCQPMMAEGGALGLLHVVLSEESTTTDEDEALFARRMSEQLGLALANLRLREKLSVEAMEDPLTGLFNRRFLEISLERESARAERERSQVAVAMVDVDHFKRFNDEHGHEAGDAVLRQLGEVLEESCRAVDLACRFGGEEFTVVFPEGTREVLAIWAERLLGRVRRMKVVADGLVLPRLTVSIGIAFFPEHGEESAEVIQTADRALYAAKDAGRNRYLFSSETPGSAAGGGGTTDRD